MSCRACGLDHSPLVRCEVAKRLVVHAEPMVVHAPLVVHDGSSQVVTGSSRHGQYLDIGKRRSYRREWMKAERAIKSGRACRRVLVSNLM